MKGCPNGVMPFDLRILSLLDTLHDVQGAPKTAIYPNGSAKVKLESLIDRGFVQEVPVPFSNTRYCSITGRGRVLFDALTLVETIWDSSPGAELGFRIICQRADGEEDGGSEEPVARTPTETETVQAVLPVEMAEDEGETDGPPTEPLNDDEKVGENVSETESADIPEGGEQ